MLAAIPNLNAVAIPKVPPPRVKFNDQELLVAAQNTQAYGALLTTAQQFGVVQQTVDSLLQLLIRNMRLSSSEEGISSKDLKQALVACGMGNTAARNKICTALLAALAALPPGADRNDNDFVRIAQGGRLDASHLSNVFIKRDGVIETFNSGQDPISVRVRQVAGELFRIAEAQLDRALRFEQEHKLEEGNRRRSYNVLKDSYIAAMPVGTVTDKSAEGRLRQFAAHKYDAMGVVDRTAPGFETAKTSMLTVAPATQLARRLSRAVADNLSIVAKDADRWMNSTVAQDLRRPAVTAQILAAPNMTAKRKIASNAMNERVARLKRFNVFHEDPQMVGVDSNVNGPQMVARDQANYYLNQEADKQRFQ